MAASPPTPGWDDVFSAAARTMQFSAIRRMSALIERPGIISFAPGQPSPETFPTEAFLEIVADVARRESAQAFQYIHTRGLAALNAAILDYVAAKGIYASLPEVLVTDGSQQGIDLLCRVLVDPGDVILVELPSYIGATSAFRAARAEMVGVRLDPEGLDIAHLREQHAAALLAGKRVKFLYVIPSFQNPSGISHTLERRRALLQAAHELGLLVVEDDPYGDLAFEGEVMPTLRALDPSVLYLSSFSKILAPGLRTAFLIGPEPLLAKVEIAKQSTNLCGSSLDQRIVLGCLKTGLLEEQKARIKPYYRGKRDAMLEALQEEMPEGASWTRPAGGLFVWMSLPEGGNAETMLEDAITEGVAYVAGRPFYVDDSGARTLRLTFAKEDAPTLREGVKRLARAVRKQGTAA